MRCSQARRRLIRNRGKVPGDDRQLREHLSGCFRCAAFARAEQALERDLAAGGRVDSDGIPMSALRTRVEARVDALQKTKTKEIPVMSAVIKNIRRRPSIGLTIGLVAIVLAVVTLIPFSFENTVGYEMAIAGINKDLAMDSDRINQLMAALGLDDARVNVGDCEETCVLKISDLDSEGEVKIVATAFDKLGNCVLEDVHEVSGKESMTLLQKAKKKIFITSVSSSEDGKVSEIVIEALGDLDSISDGQFNIWVSKENDSLIVHNLDGSGDGPKIITMSEGVGDKARVMVNSLKGDPDGHRLFISGDPSLKITDQYSADGDSMTMTVTLDKDDVGNTVRKVIELEKSGDGGRVIIVPDENGEMHEISLDDPDFEEQLAELGFEIVISESGEGTEYTLTHEGDGEMTEMEITVKGDEAEEPVSEKADSSTPLPDGFELDQNHPNPFNPTTTIAFAIPEPQDVRLEIYNVNGQKVRTLVDGYMAAGQHRVDWNSRDDNGQRVASGIYLYLLTAGEITTSKKMTLLK